MLVHIFKSLFGFCRRVIVAPFLGIATGSVSGFGAIQWNSWRIISWSLGLICSLVLLSALGIAFAMYEYLPRISPAPDNPIGQIPYSEQGDREVLQPYQGLHPRMSQRPDEVFDFPIRLGEVGPVEPLFAKVNAYPFLCGQDKIHKQKPLVDNHQGIGMAVFDDLDDGEKVLSGYSQDCLHPTRAQYYFKSATDGKFRVLGSNDHPIAKTRVMGRKIDYVVRLESGTINRHFYLIAALRGEAETLEQPTASYWNRRLLYQFRGGVGIGKRQGNIKVSDVLDRRDKTLGQGYAIVYSSANQTSNHYNMWLAEDTAWRVKRQFQSLYGPPLYTVGLGGSGGAVQQYLLAQNHPGLLDAIIPLYSYPDMVTQTTYIFDCEPLEYFFDVLDGTNPRWAHRYQRSLVEGLSSTEDAKNYYRAVNSLAAGLQGNFASLSLAFEGSNECVSGWRGLTPLVHNPTFVHFKRKFTDELSAQVQWSHWSDLRHFYGTDSSGIANSTWDNVGVQYGLQSLREHDLNMEDFLKINASIGGWKSQADMVDEEYWVMQEKILPVKLSFWSHQNINVSDSLERPAVRTEGHLKAIEGAYRSGHVFVGEIDIPILDVRHYLDAELDMHHASASFSARARIAAQQGRADHHVIWMSHKDHNPISMALSVMDQWMLNRLANPALSVSQSKPELAQDMCLDVEGDTIASGAAVWDGYWNGLPAGACTKVYPIYPTSRELAGASVAGDVFKCQRQSVTAAISAGLYGDIDVWPYLDQLESIFPDGVCDYSLADAGRPQDLLAGALVQDAIPMGESHGADVPTGSGGEIKRDRTKSTLQGDAELALLPAELLPAELLPAQRHPAALLSTEQLSPSERLAEESGVSSK